VESKKPNKPPPDDPEQSKRFVETAKELSDDKSASLVSEAFKRLLRIRRVSGGNRNK
jgi:hypothetical protein